MSILILFKLNYVLASKSSSVPMTPNLKLSNTDGDLLPDREAYRSLVGRLMYLCITRPDITFAVNKLCQFSSAPRTTHLKAVHKVLQYLKGTIGQGLLYSADADLTLTVLMLTGHHVRIVGGPLLVLLCFLVPL